MPSLSNASYLIIARFVFIFLNIMSISEVFKKVIIISQTTSKQTLSGGVEIIMVNEKDESVFKK